MFRLTAAWLLVFACSTKVFYADEIPVRYNGAQFWRVYDINNPTLMNVVEEKYGGHILTEHMNYTDVVINSENLKATRQFLEANDIQKEVLLSNIQHLIDEEKPKSSRTSRSTPRRELKNGMNWKQYHDLDAIYEYLEDISKRYPNITTLYTIGKTIEGRELKVLRISDDPENYQKIWIDGGIHAREWISPASVTYIMNELISKWLELPSYLKKFTWYFMPVANPDGYVYSRKTDRLWRKNRSKSLVSKCIGVDLNRNFLTGWELSSNDPCSYTYGGTAAGSELETKAIMKFLLEHKTNLKSYLSFHSYGQFLLYPYAFKSESVKNAAELLKIGKRAAKRIKKKTGQTYTSGRVSTLLKQGKLPGTSSDWSYNNLGAKYAYTMELRDKGKYSFLLPANQIISSSYFRENCGRSYKMMNTIFIYKFYI